MKKLKTLAFGLALANVIWGASITLDDFTVNQGPVSSITSSTVGIANGVQRTIAITSAGGTAPELHSIEVSDGVLDMINGTGDWATFALVYMLPVGFPASAISDVSLQVVLSDLNVVTITLGGDASGFALIPGGTVSTTVNWAQPGIQPSWITFEFAGDPGFDLAVSSITMQTVPEPGSLFLAACGFAFVWFGKRKMEVQR